MKYPPPIMYRLLENILGWAGWDIRLTKLIDSTNLHLPFAPKNVPAKINSTSPENQSMQNGKTNRSFQNRA